MGFLCVHGRNTQNFVIISLDYLIYPPPQTRWYHDYHAKVVIVSICA